jgi:DNA-binding GntR family transcriptional regulator
VAPHGGLGGVGVARLEGLESHCARAGAVRGSHDSIAAMKKAVDAMAAMREKGVNYRNYRSYLEQEQTFHQALIDSAGNDVISDSHRELHLILSHRPALGR